MNVTPMRVKAMQLIAAHPGIYLGALAEKLEFRGRYEDGRRIGNTAQGATRWGGGYTAPMARAGLVRKDGHVDCGGARLYITEAGKAWLDAALLASGLEGN